MLLFHGVKECGNLGTHFDVDEGITVSSNLLEGGFHFSYIHEQARASFG